MLNLKNLCFELLLYKAGSVKNSTKKIKMLNRAVVNVLVYRPNHKATVDSPRKHCVHNYFFISFLINFPNYFL